jgi:3-dehydroquinate synthetase
MTSSGTITVDLDRRITFGGDSYPYIVCSGPGAWDDLTARLAALDADRLVAVIDPGVPKDARQLILGCLGEAAPVTACEVPGGEEGKTSAAVARVMHAALEAGATRASVIVGVGGGRAGNLAGMAAGRLYRGVRLFHIATTLLALSDSALSTKQAGNVFTEQRASKNTDGLFHAPTGVWGCLDLLSTLPADEIRAGLCEGAKNLVAILDDRVPEFRGLFRPAADYTCRELVTFTAMCVDAKQLVMRDDPREEGPGLALEYGHTTGHVLELLCGMPHGMAIGVGGLVAARAARILGITGDSLVEDVHADLLRRIGAPVAVPAGLPDDALLRGIRLDNKRGYRKIPPQHVDMVLLEAPGRVHHTAGWPLTPVPEQVVLRAIRELEAAA